MSILQLVGKRISLTPGDDWGDVAPSSQIVVIGEQGSLDSAGLQAQFDSCKVDAAVTPEGAQLVTTVLRWLRGKK
jgi:hypothetical protein